MRYCELKRPKRNERASIEPFYYYMRVKTDTRNAAARRLLIANLECNLFCYIFFPFVELFSFCGSRYRIAKRKVYWKKCRTLFTASLNFPWIMTCRSAFKNSYLLTINHKTMFTCAFLTNAVSQPPPRFTAFNSAFEIIKTFLRFAKCKKKK